MTKQLFNKPEGEELSHQIKKNRTFLMNVLSFKTLSQSFLKGSQSDLFFVRKRECMQSFGSELQLMKPS